METREERHPKMTGPCPNCGGEVILHTSVNNEVGYVCDGDNASCASCYMKGVFCGAPSDGLGVDWETPLVGSRWRRPDCSNKAYTVFCITNIDHISEKHPPQVVYKGDNDLMWSLPLADWPGSLVPKECEICNKAAVLVVQDIKKRDNYELGCVEKFLDGQPHNFCKAHDRYPKERTMMPVYKKD